MRFRKTLNDQLIAWRMDGGLRRVGQIRRGVWEFGRRCLRNRMVDVGLAIIVIMVALALLAPVLPLADPTPSELDPEKKILPPSATNWFGTDELGRDIFSRVIWGTRVSLTVATVAVLLSLMLGMVLGLTAGYFGGKVDYIIAGTIDLFWTFPPFLLALALAAALGPSLQNVIVAISISYWAGFARLMRGQALSVRERLFVEASRALGANNSRIMFWHVLPNCLAPLIVWASIGVVLLITVLGFNLFGDGLRDVLDPRMKGLRR